MLNFTVGPVMCSDAVRAVGGEQVPYFRTPEFSNVMFENEQLMLKFAKAPKGSRAAFMTNSSTGSMEAVVMNCFDGSDKVLVIDGGSFGHRFVELCEIHEVPHVVLHLYHGQKLTKERLYEYDSQGFTGLLVNIDETSTGVLYDSEMIGEFCKKNRIFYVCDCVSSFLADPFDMSHCGADVMITGSQKVLACPPGISIIILVPRAVERVNTRKVKSMYFNLADVLNNMERGQTPFTPAVGILRQINTRLKEIEAAGGADVEIARVAAQAEDFRQKIKELPFEFVSESPANGVTPVHPLNADAYKIFEILKDEYEIWICPNGGDMKNTIFRVGHIGYLSHDDNTTLINALKDKEKTAVLNGAGVNTETYAYQPYPNNETVKFLFVGRVMKEKGIDELFEAMKRLISEGNKCFLDVIGPFEEDYKENLEECEKAGWLKYHGFQEDVRPFIATCDCFVLPSYHEGMANTNLECASSGRPIITSNIPGCKEAVVEGTGFLCDPRNAESLYEAMKKMIVTSREEREKMGKVGRKHMEDVFDRRKVVEETIKALSL